MKRTFYWRSSCASAKEKAREWSPHRRRGEWRGRNFKLETLSRVPLPRNHECQSLVPEEAPLTPVKREKKKDVDVSTRRKERGKGGRAQTGPFDLILDFSDCETRTNRIDRSSNGVPCNAKMVLQRLIIVFSHSCCHSRSRIHGNFDRTHRDWMTGSLCYRNYINICVNTLHTSGIRAVFYDWVPLVKLMKRKIFAALIHCSN